MIALKPRMRDLRNATGDLHTAFCKRASWIPAVALLLVLMAMPPSVPAANAAALQPVSQGFVTVSVQFMPMPKIWLSSQAFWMDDSRLIFSTSDMNSEGRAGGNPKIAIFDVRTKRLEPTTYSGYLYCYSSARMIVDAGTRAGKPIILSGQFGQPLKELESHRRPLTTGVDCGDVSVDHDERRVDLEPGDGAVRYTGGPAQVAENRFIVEFLSAGGTAVTKAQADLFTVPATLGFVYLPWSHTYAREGAFAAQRPIAGSLIDPKDGSITPVLGPKRLTDLADANQGSGNFYVTRSGLLWRFRAYKGRSNLQGLFLETSSGLSRIDDHDVWLASNVSPDGCKFFYGRIAGEHIGTSPFEHRDVYDVVLLNVCKGGNE